MTDTGLARNISEVEAIARRIRIDVIRMIAPHGQGYVTQGLGAADIFAALYAAELRIDPACPTWPGRDRMILSTAHNSAVFHATLAACRLIDRSRLDTYCRDGSELEINVSERLGPLVEATCGSLGQGLSVGVGMAVYGKRTAGGYRTYVLLGDGEMQEGQVWEAAMSAANYELDNLCVIVDLNRMQVEGHTDRAMKMDPIAEKWQSFGWRTIEIDGHSMPDILASFDAARLQKTKPTVIIANTVPGKGVPSIEGQLRHFMQLAPDMAARALDELGA